MASFGHIWLFCHKFTHFLIVDNDGDDSDDGNSDDDNDDDGATYWNIIKSWPDQHQDPPPTLASLGHQGLC